MYQVLLFKLRRHLCKGSIDVLIFKLFHLFIQVAERILWFTTIGPTAGMLGIAIDLGFYAVKNPVVVLCLVSVRSPRFTIGRFYSLPLFV